MRRIKNLVAATLLVVISLFSASFLLAQSRTNSQITQDQLSQIKGKRRIFVDLSNEMVKRQVEDVLSRNRNFQVVQDLKDAEIVYSSALQVESKPSFGTLGENRSSLPKLPSEERSSTVERNQDAQFYQNQYEYRRKTSVFVYYDEPDGKRVPLWSMQTTRITKSKESGATLEYFRKSGDEVQLAKQFVKAVNKLN